MDKYLRWRNRYNEAGLAVGFRSGLRELEQWQGFDRTLEPACDDRAPDGETRAY
ncbi:hypothetical protein ABEX47_15045 [Paenibacillus ehimensis]|uniref:hypothetical protein n=1 Tax=Paenibacillus ehimensis TaxID=79264 RepID=UPI002DBD761C|nr:hypothetical protein [Paenibacillus ehimensis]MEC0213296.1 hypothetical protein [Paenibacillus ehimensis]